MTSDWFSDPKTVALVATGFSQVVISIWLGRQTAQALRDLNDWRNEVLQPWQSKVDTTLARIETQVLNNSQEIERLRRSRGET